MAVSDSIADFLTCVRNASKAKKEVVVVPASNMIVSIAQIMKDEKFIKDFRVVEEGNKRFIHIFLKYLKDKKPAIKGIRKITKPSLRKYVGVDSIPKVMNGLGVVVLSTSKGVMTGKKCREENVGGEVICTIW